jgi:hypothetical protein
VSGDDRSDKLGVLPLAAGRALGAHAAGEGADIAVEGDIEETTEVRGVREQGDGVVTVELAVW